MSYFQQIKDKARYQELLDKVLFKTFFHILEWENFLEKEFKWLKFEHYLYKDQAILSLAKYKIFGKEKLVSHPFCEYGGVLPLVKKIDAKEFEQSLFSEFKIPFKINLHPWILNYFENFQIENRESWRSTYWIENFSKLTKEQFLASFRYDIRHSIKNAERQGFSFEECQSDKDIKEFYEIYIKTVRRHKNIPLSYSFFEFFQKSSKIFFIKINKKIATGSIFLFYKPFIHYFITASDYNFRKSGVNHLLLWNIIKNYNNKDYDFLDLGATKKGSNLEIFKRGWRGKKLPIYELVKEDKSSFPPFATARVRDSKLRSILGFLPSCLIKKISPYLLKYKL